MKMLAWALPFSLAVLVPTLIVACNKPPEPIPEAEKAAPAASEVAPMASTAGLPAGHPPLGSHAGLGAEPAPAKADDLAWTAPSTWVSAPNPSPMRTATYKIPKAAGDAKDAELAISAAGGGVDANIKRWEGQFGDAKAKTEARTVNGLKVTVVEIHGKYGGMMGAAAPGAAPAETEELLGAVVDSGDQQHFFKMIGGEKTVNAAKKDFDKFVSSLHAK
jgi:hypothetical protein